jgi:hypothetical protein
VHQGDPLSSILFNIVVDMLAILISRATEADHIRGVVPYLVDERMSVLQYADDTVIFMDNDLERAKKRSYCFVLFSSRAQDQFP